jgi:hypothetical protein
LTNYRIHDNMNDVDEEKAKKKDVKNLMFDSKIEENAKRDGCKYCILCIMKLQTSICDVKH